jgi:hypothetical protein
VGKWCAVSGGCGLRRFRGKVLFGVEEQLLTEIADAAQGAGATLRHFSACRGNMKTSVRLQRADYMGDPSEAPSDHMGGLVHL